MALGIVKAAPGMVAVVIILIAARVVVRVLHTLFDGVESGRLRLTWLQPETVGATRRISTLLVWLFAITVAYPYIPGSETPAFRGISVFVGLMLSLGSAGLVNQVMSGLVVVYARAIHPGEYVRIGDNEGIVSEVGLLSTKLTTFRKEEVTIPNAVLVGTATTNYSRLADEQGAVVSTSVTIGYDAPWRQVEAMLLLAAERTADVRKQPAAARRAAPARRLLRRVRPAGARRPARPAARHPLGIARADPGCLQRVRHPDHVAALHEPTRRVGRGAEDEVVRAAGEAKAVTRRAGKSRGADRIPCVPWSDP